MAKLERGNYVELLIPIIILSFFLIYPVTRVIVGGVLSSTSNPFQKILSDYPTQFAIAFTFSQAFISTIASVMVGLPGALIISRLDFKGKSLVRALIVVPFVLPPIAVVVGIIQMFGSYGIIDSFLMSLFHSSTSVFNISDGIVGIVLAHTFYNAPLVILLVSSSLERMNPEIEDAADMLGANSIQRFKRITLPQILPALSAAAILTFIFCFMSFPIVLALGNDVYNTIEILIWNSYKAGHLGLASSLALLQILITLTLAVVYLRLGRTRNQDVAPTSTIRTIRFTKYRYREQGLILVYMLSMLIFIGGPMISIFRAAVYDPMLQQYTAKGLVYLFTSGTNGGLGFVINTLFYGFLATLLSIILGIPLAYAHKSEKRILPTLSSMMVLLPLGISSITLAYGLMEAIAVPLGLSLHPWPIIVIAQTIIGLPFTARALEISLNNIDPNILNQADLLGASRFQRFFFVDVPLLLPGILVGAVFAFAMAIGDMTATLLIAIPANYTVAVGVYKNLDVRKFVQAGASALFLVIICVLAYLIMEKVSKGSTGSAL